MEVARFIAILVGPTPKPGRCGPSWRAEIIREPRARKLSQRQAAEITGLAVV